MINDIVKSGSPPPAPVRESAPVPAAVSAQPVPPQPVPPVEEPQAEVEAQNPQRLEAAVSKLNDYVQNIRRTLSFSIEESTGRTVIKVYDSETEELIRQIPPEDTLKLAELIDQHPDSLFISDRA